MKNRLTLCLVGAALAVTMIACSSRSPATKATTSPTPTPTGPFVSVVLTAGDAGSAGPAVTEILPPTGQGLRDTTLDLCELNYPSDLKRADRLQVLYVNPQKMLIDSNEVVRYQPGGAMQAYTELKDAQKRCPSQTKAPNNDVLSHFAFHDAGAGFPSTTVLVTFDDAQYRGGPIGVADLYMFQGNVLDALYIYRMNTDDALHDALALGRIALQKLSTVATR